MVFLFLILEPQSWMKFFSENVFLEFPGLGDDKSCPSAPCVITSKKSDISLSYAAATSSKPSEETVPSNKVT